MTRLSKTVLFYIIVAGLNLLTLLFSRTNMSGPGLDIVVYIVSVIACIGVLAKSLIIKEGEKKADRGIIQINLVGTAVVIALPFIL
jgi:hypothetical protein